MAKIADFGLSRGEEVYVKKTMVSDDIILFGFLVSKYQMLAQISHTTKERIAFHTDEMFKHKNQEL